MNPKIKNFLDSMIAEYDPGVAELKYYPITDLWEINTEDVLEGLNLLDDISEHLAYFHFANDEECVDIHCIFKRRKTYIYLKFSDENSFANNSK